MFFLVLWFKNIYYIYIKKKKNVSVYCVLNLISFRPAPNEKYVLRFVEFFRVSSSYVLWVCRSAGLDL